MPKESSGPRVSDSRQLRWTLLGNLLAATSSHTCRASARSEFRPHVAEGYVIRERTEMLCEVVLDAEEGEVDAAASERRRLESLA